MKKKFALKFLIFIGLHIVSLNIVPAHALNCATYLTGIEISCNLAANDDSDYVNCVYSRMADGGFEDEENYTMAGEDDYGYPFFTCGRQICLKEVVKANKDCASTNQSSQKSCFRVWLKKSGLTEGKDFKFSSKTNRLFCK